MSQTFNDLFKQIDHRNDQPIIEALSDYYFTHGESFEGLVIEPENQKIFDKLKNWAIEYYDEI